MPKNKNVLSHKLSRELSQSGFAIAEVALVGFLIVSIVVIGIAVLKGRSSLQVNQTETTSSIAIHISTV